MDIYNDPDLLAELRRLAESKQFDLFWDRVYQTITQNEQMVYASNMEFDQKLRALNQCMDYYVKQEDYRRCAELKRIIGRLTEIYCGHISSN